MKIIIRVTVIIAVSIGIFLFIRNKHIDRLLEQCEAQCASGGYGSFDFKKIGYLNYKCHCLLDEQGE